jgi:transposase-like protein
MMEPKRTAPRATTTERPSTETQARQGTFTAAQKLTILAEYESYERGDPRRGELLRRVGAYTSHISKWRDQRDRGTLTSQKQPTVGRPAQPRDPQQDEIARLQRENARLTVELEKAQFVIAIQKKVATLLGMAPVSLPNDDG